MTLQMCASNFDLNCKGSKVAHHTALLLLQYVPPKKTLSCNGTEWNRLFCFHLIICHYSFTIRP